MSALLFFTYRLKHKQSLKTGHLSYYTLILGWWLLILLSLALQGGDPAYALAVSAHSGVFIIFYFLIVNRVSSVRSLLVCFIGSMCFQSCLAVMQFLAQGSLGLHFLGEPFLDEGARHLSKMTIAGKDFIRSYGTLPHPNVLGGFLSLSMMGTFFISIKKKGLKTALLTLQFLGLMFSFSRSALISLSFALILMALLYRSEIKKHSKKFMNTVIFVLTLELLVVLWSRIDDLSQSTGERLKGFYDAIMIFDSNPLGVGFQSHTLHLDAVSTVPLMPWDYQPVHNIFLLMLSELGVFGLLLGTWFFLFSILKLYERRKHLLTKQRLQKKRLLLCAILVIALIGLFDHYWLSLHQGLALLIFFFGLASAFSLDPSHVKAIKKGAVLKQTPIDPTQNL